MKSTIVHCRAAQIIQFICRRHLDEASSKATRPLHHFQSQHYLGTDVVDSMIHYKHCPYGENSQTCTVNEKMLTPTRTFIRVQQLSRRNFVLFVPQVTANSG